MAPEEPPDDDPTPSRPSDEERPAASAELDDTTPADPPPPAWRKIPGFGRMQTAGRAFGASIGVAAALGSVVVGYLAIPQGISSEDWGRRVNAICEKNAAELRDPMRNALEGMASLLALLEDPTNVSAVVADLHTTSRDIQDTADSYRVVIGQIREIERPDDLKKIDALLETGSELYRALDDIASRLISASSSVAPLVANPGNEDLLATATQTIASLTTAVKKAETTEFPEYQAAITDLDLEQCAVRTVPAPVTEGLDEEQAALAHQWGFDDAECTPASNPASAKGALAQINCKVQSMEVDPFFISFEDLEGLESWFVVKKDRVADCGSGQAAEYALPDSPHQGRLRCYDNGNRYRVEVMLPDSLVGFAAEAKGPIALERQATQLIARLDAD